MEGTVFNIKRYAIHDGPGIRTTVFLKGCPLSCPWCQNPEGIGPRPELMWRAQRCLGCRDCEDTCLENAITFPDEGLHLDENRCDLCGQCAIACHSEALELIGRHMTVREVMAEIEKDSVFYEESGGGVTLSGGEPLMQPDFLEGILTARKEQGVNTALDTSGYADRDSLIRVAGLVGLFLWDLKTLDDETHRKYTGVSNTGILDNLKTVSGMSKQAVIRFSLIPGVNDFDTNIQAMGAFAALLEGVSEIDILPYHRAWVDKYKSLNRTREPVIHRCPSAGMLKMAETKLAGFGLKTRIGG